MSTVVYRTTCTDWRPDAVTDVYRPEDLLTWPLPVNLTSGCSGSSSTAQTPWGDLPGLRRSAPPVRRLLGPPPRLLYINSSNKSSFHEDLAKALAGTPRRAIEGTDVYRAMYGIQRMIPTNVGVLDVRNRNRRFQMLVGANVSEGFPTGEAQTKTQTNIFASGFEDGRARHHRRVAQGPRVELPRAGRHQALGRLVRPRGSQARRRLHRR